MYTGIQYNLSIIYFWSQLLLTVGSFYGKEDVQMQKAQYGILRFAKYKGPEISNIEAHNERKKENYASNPDIDASRRNLNYHLIQPAGKYRVESNRLIEEAGCRTRKDSVRVVEALITATPEFFKGKKKSELKAYFQSALEFIEKYQDSKTILSAVVHMDEKTPHMHLSFVPLTQDGRLCAKEILGNKKKMTWWQDEFWKHMVKKYPDLERGEAASVTGREHIPPRLFKEAAHLTQQAKQITDLLENTNFLNAGKNTDKAISLLQKFFPALEDFQTQIKKYDKTISSLRSDKVTLQKQKKKLEQQVKEANSSSMQKKMDDARLRADYHNLQCLVNRIPPEILELANRRQLNRFDSER